MNQSSTFILDSVITRRAAFQDKFRVLMDKPSAFYAVVICKDAAVQQAKDVFDFDYWPVYET